MSISQTAHISPSSMSQNINNIFSYFTNMVTSTFALIVDINILFITLNASINCSTCECKKSWPTNRQMIDHTVPLMSQQKKNNQRKNNKTRKWKTERARFVDFIFLSQINFDLVRINCVHNSLYTRCLSVRIFCLCTPLDLIYSSNPISRNISVRVVRWLLEFVDDTHIYYFVCWNDQFCKWDLNQSRNDNVFTHQIFVSKPVISVHESDNNQIRYRTTEWYNTELKYSVWTSKQLFHLFKYCRQSSGNGQPRSTIWRVPTEL